MKQHISINKIVAADHHSLAIFDIRWTYQYTPHLQFLLLSSFLFRSRSCSCSPTCYRAKAAAARATNAPMAACEALLSLGEAEGSSEVVSDPVSETAAPEVVLVARVVELALVAMVWLVEPVMLVGMEPVMVL